MSRGRKEERNDAMQGKSVEGKKDGMKKGGGHDRTRKTEPHQWQKVTMRTISTQ